MDTFTIVANVVISLLVIGVWSLSNRVGKKWWGPQTYKQFFSRRLSNALITGVLLFGFSQLKVTLVWYLPLAGTILFGGLLLRHRILQNKPRPILLDLGPTEKESFHANEVFVVGFALMLFVLCLIDQRSIGEFLLLAACVTLGLIYCHEAGQSASLILRSGIHTSTAVVKWDQIKAYQWENREGEVDTLLIHRKTWPILFDLVAIRVPIAYKRAVNGLLGQNVSQQVS